jgi:2,3-bisphosphoglycerate-independent phosphoglycerate mutase
MGPGNAIALADTPVFDGLRARCAHSQLAACGRAVGLPEGQMGNSEVGHLNLGAGRVIEQDLTRIDDAVAEGRLAENEVLLEAFAAADRVHLIGLVSDGGVHSSLEHCGRSWPWARDVPDLVVHAFTDGRDTLPHAGAGFLESVDTWCAQAGNARVGSVVGRFFAMDRDRRADRTQKAYDLLVAGHAEHHTDTGAQAARDAYERGETDEFIEPTTVGEEARIRPDDAVVAFNFRPDRMREITERLGPEVARYTTLTEYEEGWPYPIAFTPAHPPTTLAHVIAAAGRRQLHVAETEKYPHVTYFFGGGEEEPEHGERRELVPSPRDVPTYDYKPEMSARAAADAFVAAWARTGRSSESSTSPTRTWSGIRASSPPQCAESRPSTPAWATSWRRSPGRAARSSSPPTTATPTTCLEPDGSPNTAHSLNPVPVIVVTPDGAQPALRDGGVLADVAPTLLALSASTSPSAMTGPLAAGWMSRSRGRARGGERLIQ